VPDHTPGEQDPLLAKLLAAATTCAALAGPASKRQPVRIVLGFWRRARWVQLGRLGGQVYRDEGSTSQEPRIAPRHIQTP
jgi:hypothetical protein